MAQQALELTTDSLKTIKSQITAIDVQLDAVSGGNAGKRSVQNGLVSAHDDSAEKIASQIVNAINKLSGEEKMGVYFGVLSKVEDALSEEMDQELETLFASQKQDVPKLSETEVSELAEKRKALNQSFKTLKEALTLFGIEGAEDIEDPKIRRGRQSRGPTIWGKYQYTINGEPLAEEVNSMRTVAQRAGIKVSEVKEAMAANGVDVKSPPQSFSVSLPNNVEMSATALEEFVAEFTEEQTPDGSTNEGTVTEEVPEPANA